MSDYFYPTDGTKALKKLRDFKPDSSKRSLSSTRKLLKKVH